MSKANAESCEAWLYIDKEMCTGKTGNQHGHAEMDALHSLIATSGVTVKLAVAGAAKKLTEAKKKKVYCPSKKCCIKCSTVLQQLGFELEKDSYWSSEKMEPVTWGVSNNVQELFKVMKIDYKKIQQLA